MSPTATLQARAFDRQLLRQSRHCTFRSPAALADLAQRRTFQLSFLAPTAKKPSARGWLKSGVTKNCILATNIEYAAASIHISVTLFQIEVLMEEDGMEDIGAIRLFMNQSTRSTIWLSEQV